MADHHRATHVGPHKVPYKRSVAIAPQGILNRRFLMLKKLYPHSDLSFFRDFYLPAHGVQFREQGDGALIIAIADNPYAATVIRKEANSVRGKIQRGMTVSYCIAFTDQKDQLYLHEKAYPPLEVGRLQSYPHGGQYPRGNLYIIWDEQEKQCLYIGKVSPGKDPISRIEAHFSRDVRGKTRPFWKYYLENLSNYHHWKVYILDAAVCDPVTLKSFFWDREEYEELKADLEDEYLLLAQRYPASMLDRAELALIRLYQPLCNVKLNR